MPDNSAPGVRERLTLRSQLADLAQVFPWVDALARQYSIPPQTQFAICLCLEEALSNIVRHGYKSDPDQSMSVEFRQGGEEELTFIVEDAAVHFRPFDPDAPQQPAPANVQLEKVVPGGQGLRLMRKFADSVAWEPLERGNRLTLIFSVKR